MENLVSAEFGGFVAGLLLLGFVWWLVAKIKKARAERDANQSGGSGGGGKEGPPYMSQQ